MLRSPRTVLFLLGLEVLFLELALIRWLPAHVLYLTFFTNVVLLASFLGLSLGCLAAGRTRDLLPWTAPLLALTMGAAWGVERLRPALQSVVDVGHQASPELVFFGTDAVQSLNPPLPVEALAGLFFALTALVFLGPGQALGRALRRSPDTLAAYGANVLGSLAGTALFTAFCGLEVSPVWWFLAIAAVLEALLPPLHRTRAAARAGRLASWALVLAAAWSGAGSFSVPGPAGPVAGERLWSPYYRVDYLAPPVRDIRVNLIGHQRMLGRDAPSAAYSLPHLLRRDAGGPAFEDVLVIGAGSGNDVSRALQWGARRVDAVEIDPVLQRLGARDHPDRPYQDPRVSVIIDDGRHVLRESPRRYDLIVYALVDSLVLHSGYSDIRLESYLFTREALADARRRLKPGGALVMYNFFRQGWIVGRLHRELREAFGEDPLVIASPYRAVIGPDTPGGLTMLLAGDTGPVRDAFRRRGVYRLARAAAVGPGTPDGFREKPGPGTMELRLSEVAVPDELRAATDDWPFLYLRRPMIPALSLRGAAVMSALAALLLAAVLPSGLRGRWLDRRMFFLGAGFMLVEAKAVVTMALLCGSTWTSNAAVFLGVLALVLLANAAARRLKPARLWPYLAGALACLALGAALPPAAFLVLPALLRPAAGAAVSLSPLLFSGIVFATLFSRSATPDEGFASNVAGAMCGGLAEYASMRLGFGALNGLAALFYLLAA